MAVRDRPLYLQVYASLRAQIEKGDVKVGEYLPPEPELQKRFKVSRTTVRKAVDLLSKEGRVDAMQGRGTEVLDFKAIQNLQYVTSFSETLRDKGFSVRYRDITVDFVSGPQRVVGELKINPDVRLVRIQRTTLANEKPIALMTNYLLPDLVPGIETKIANMKSLYSFLEEEYAITIERAIEYISAKPASLSEAEKLNVSVGSPLLVVRRITQSDRRPFEVAILLINANKFEYSVYTKDRPPRANLS
jgi:GntR family transcriptional regulator